MMNKLQIVQEYINAVQKQEDAEIGVSDALRKLNPDNYTIGFADHVMTAYNHLIADILGKEAWDWLTWWMWETDFGQKSEFHFWVNNVKYDPSGLTFEEFWKIVNDDPL